MTYITSAVRYIDILNRTLRSRTSRLKKRTDGITRAHHYYRKFCRYISKALQELNTQYYMYVEIEDDEDELYELEMELYEQAYEIINMYNTRFRKKLIALS